MPRDDTFSKYVEGLPAWYIAQQSATTDDESADRNVTQQVIDHVSVDSGQGAYTVTLGVDVEVDGNTITVTDVGNNANTNPITVTAESGALINRRSTLQLTRKRASVTLTYYERTGAWHTTAYFSGGGVLR
ncbi:hypothetical protein [Halomarina oriensis]|uniref:Uncharacterized protein n=1 Tax=Halomarina oriensis TaxID=671145 RepID=A0A6B0GWG4_9EURY|nr:hypothetical protein [Halomarina oriensis]MWG36485.1 hypothetical protein [Halomarina oriensis]